MAAESKKRKEMSSNGAETNVENKKGRKPFFKKQKKDELLVIQTTEYRQRRTIYDLLAYENKEGNGFMNNWDIIKSCIKDKTTKSVYLGKELVGFFIEHFSSHRWKNELELTMFFVSPQHRRQGIGRRIVQQIIQTAKESQKGIPRIQVKPVSTDEAWMFWRSLGFQYFLDHLPLQEDLIKTFDKMSPYQRFGMGNLHLAYQLEEFPKCPLKPDGPGDTYYCKYCDLFHDPEHFDSKQLLLPTFIRRCSFCKP
jgi:GNAT superfamily N-acetyltransferase